MMKIGAWMFLVPVAVFVAWTSAEGLIAMVRDIISDVRDGDWRWALLGCGFVVALVGVVLVLVGGVIG